MFGASLELDAATARRIGDDMLRVALADGDVHPRELALIEGFRAEIPTAEAGANLTDPEVRRAWLHSLVLVALADGVVSPEERVVIIRLAEEHAISDVEVDAQIFAAKRWFLEHFSGVTIFREAVADIAAELGVPAQALA